MSNERERNDETIRPGMAADGSAVTGEEREWAAALQRVAAPESFADRVMGRIASGEVAASPAAEANAGDAAATAKRGAVLQFRWPVWSVAYAAAALLALTVGTFGVQHHRTEQRLTEQRRMDAAAAQFDEAMQVTGHALDHVSAQLEQGEVGAVERALAKGGGK